MRVLSVVVGLFLLAGGVSAAEVEPVGSLAEVMRAILFPNSNILFDVQTGDPEKMAEKQEGDSVSSTFSGIYKGWMVVDQAAIALAEVEALIMAPGRLCDNGKPAPIENEDYQKWARQLTDVGKQVLVASRARDQEKVSELTNLVAGACEDCHTKYRRYEDRCR